MPKQRQRIMGRPAKDINPQQLKALMRLKPSLADTAAFFECTERTIENVVKTHFSLTFFDFREQNAVHSRLSMIRKAISKAEAGDNCMLIFCLKNLCGWKDRYDTTSSVKQETTHKIDDTSKENVKAILDAALNERSK